MEKVRIGGLANATGFQIFDLTNRINVKTKDYQETDWEKLYKIRCKTIGMPRIILKLLLTILSKMDEWECRRYRPAGEGLLSEWHSCEHKLIWLLENKKGITLKALKQAPDYSPRCGRGKKQILCLKEPSQEKLEETLRVGQEYYRRLGQVKTK